MAIGKLLYQGVLWRGIYFASAFALNIVIARHLEAAGSGTLFYIVNIFSFFLLVVSLCTESGIGFFTANQQIDSRKLISFSIIYTLIITVLSLFGLVAFIDFSGGSSRISFMELIISIAFISGNYLLSCGTILFYSKENFITPNLVSTVINAGLIIFFFTSGDTGLAVTWYLLSFLLAAIIVTVCFIIQSTKGFRFQLPTGFDLQKLFSYSLRALAGNIIFFLLYRIDYWFVEKYCSPQDLGNYIQVSKLAQMFFILPGILASAIFPYTASGKREEVNLALTKICRALLMLYGTACILLALTGRWLFPWIYGEEFNNMYAPFLFLIPGILALSTLFTLTAYYAGKNRQDVNLRGAVLAFIIILAGDILFIPRYGINAAALVSSVGYISYHVYVLWIFKKEYGTPLGEFFRLRFSDLAWLRNSFLSKLKSSSK